WFRKDDDVRWQYGVPPRGNANFAWVQHFIHHLAPHGMAGFVLVRFWFWLKSRAARVIKGSDKATSESIRERRHKTLSLRRARFGQLRRRTPTAALDPAYATA
ncbi:MAG: SAM-dependent methyltransferase, partial [Verrucomicrobiota bacterium]|nr:SAM-dependent methyltransferase [Verrucomicrobiota bacterium]